MNALDLARWQFAITTVYHFLFVPITIGLGFLVAGLQTAWYRKNNLKYLRATKFFGKLFLINFAIGVVTGIVQEFQFGMNWSTYSRFVGDIFGAPLAMEGLLAFFLESTFLGLWIFGWDRLPKKLHLATIWIAATGTLLSAYFILAANSFMQHPVGYIINATKNRAELENIFTVLFQKTGAFMAGISAYLILKKKDVEMSRPTLKLGLVTVIISFLLIGITGDVIGKVMTTQQPMKMAAAEALYDTTDSAPFSLFTIGTLDGSRSVFQVDVPSVLSFLATGDFKATVKGVNDLQAEYVKKYGPGNYTPNIPLAYWSFRLMIGFGAIAFFFALFALWRTRKGGELPQGKWFLRSMIAMPFIPLAAISFGWIFTETARQPWAVFGLIKTEDGVSAVVSAGSILFTMIVFTLLYGVLAVIEVGLTLKVIKNGPAPELDYENPKLGGSSDKPLVMSY
jgi:cytochrome d ubiquinol oxidase subunit I